VLARAVRDWYQAKPGSTAACSAGKIPRSGPEMTVAVP
jgi:hypothetical protein